MAGYDPLFGAPLEKKRGPVVDFFAGSTNPAAGIPSRSEQRGVVTPLPAPPTPPGAPPPILPTPAVGGLSGGGVVGDLESRYTSDPRIRRVTDPSQPGAAPLFTNLAGADATRGIFEKPFVSPESLERTLATSSVFNATDPLAQARHAAAARGDFDAVDRSFRSDDEQVAHDLSQAQGAVGRGITNSLRNGVPAKLFPEIVQSLGYLTASNAKAAPGLDLGDYAALTNAETSQGQLANAQARLQQDKDIAAERGHRDVVKLIAGMAADPTTGATDPTRFTQLLGQLGPALGLGADTTRSAAPSAAGVDEGVANKLRAKGYSAPQIQQYLAQRAGQ